MNYWGNAPYPAGAPAGIAPERGRAMVRLQRVRQFAGVAMVMGIIVAVFAGVVIYAAAIGATSPGPDADNLVFGATLAWSFAIPLGIFWAMTIIYGIALAIFAGKAQKECASAGIDINLRAAGVLAIVGVFLPFPFGLIAGAIGLRKANKTLMDIYFPLPRQGTQRGI